MEVQQLCDAIISVLTKIFEECFEHLVQSVPQKIKAGIKEYKEYQKGVPNEMAGECL